MASLFHGHLNLGKKNPGRVRPHERIFGFPIVDTKSRRGQRRALTSATIERPRTAIQLRLHNYEGITASRWLYIRGSNCSVWWSKGVPRSFNDLSDLQICICHMTLHDALISIKRFADVDFHSAKSRITAHNFKIRISPYDFLLTPNSATRRTCWDDTDSHAHACSVPVVTSFRRDSFV
jgi:hypothetical protein